MEYWKALTRVQDLKGINFILAEVSCRYLSPAYLGETIRIGIRARNLSNRSFQFDYRMEDKASGRLITEGGSVQVMYDYKQKRTMPLEQKMRDAVAALEQREMSEISSNDQE